MRRRSFLSSLAGLAWLMVSPAQGGVLTQATWTHTVSGVSVVITNSATTCTSIGPNIVQQVISCPGTGLDATGFASGMGRSYSVALTMPAFALTQFTTGGVIDVYTKATLGNGGQILIKGSVSLGPSAAAGVAGMLTVKNTQHVATGVNASKLGPGFTTLVRVPVSVGKKSAVTAYFHLLSEPHYLTVDFYGWTPNTWTFSALSSKFSPLPNVVTMGSFAVTARGQGTVTLVSPSRIRIDGPLAQRRTVSFTTLKLAFQQEQDPVPEPSVLLLLAAGVVCLASHRVRARSRARESSREAPR